MSVTEATIRARIELLEGEHIMLENPFTRAELLEVYRMALAAWQSPSLPQRERDKDEAAS